MALSQANEPSVRLSPRHHRVTPNLVVVDDRMVAIMTGASEVWRSVGLHLRIGERLPRMLAGYVEASRQDWSELPDAEHMSIVFPWPDIAVSIFPVEVASGRHLCLSAERFRARRDLRWAERQFGFSPREAQILPHVLRGAATPQIAADLNIADSTVIAHIKSLLVKTKAANRAALVARVLGWQDSAPS